MNWDSIGVLIDPEDAERIKGRWRVSAFGYVVQNDSRKRGSTLWLHREILSASAGYDVDHINGDRLDNRKVNLRLASRSQNLANQKLSPKNTSGYKGVTWDRERSKWVAAMHIGNKRKALGRYVILEDAARAYDTAARAHWGAYACVNFPFPGERGAKA